MEICETLQKKIIEDSIVLQSLFQIQNIMTNNV